MVFDLKRMDEAHALRLNPVQWAYVGDTVYDLFVRTYVLAKRDCPIGKLNKLCVSYVNCKAQSRALLRIEEHLCEKELDVVRRGRNTKTHAAPKNADPADYQRATSLEALIGFLYLTNQDERIEELMNIIFEGEKEYAAQNR
ncbi:MAG: Mini-ribonuclease 3 [Clostridiales bacterium]|nr:Mini-ribonuclease 3 [Clostridiales bacterium]MBQ2816932.1 Mini-ribonuclease 3 [Clostridia bacterium]MBQ4637342.1 Mini-ribonuclease 3 [Clostridia bacterium]